MRAASSRSALAFARSLRTSSSALDDIPSAEEDADDDGDDGEDAVAVVDAEGGEG